MENLFSNAVKVVLTGALLWPTPDAQAQDAPTSQASIQMAAGVGFNTGRAEYGLGLLYALGYQRSLGPAARWRLNPQLVHGEFTSASFTDTRDLFYRTTSAGGALHYDLVKYRALALTVSAGAFLSYARGLFGTGGEFPRANEGSRYFHYVYFSGGGGAGLRVSPARSRLAYEFRPITFQAGSQGFFLGYATVGIEVKLNK
jgi:hypothetical protein